MLPIQMVDLHGQYLKIQSAIDHAIQQVILHSAFIGGRYVAQFEESFKDYLGVHQVVTCGNGTDALQLALMALDLQPGDEVIVPGFTFVAPAEAVALLDLTPAFADIDAQTFNMTATTISAAITPKTKAIVVVHLFGQMADMEPIMQLAQQYNLRVIEDVAQSFGARALYKGKACFAGTIGDLGCTSFFPSKNLACFGDGGAVYGNNAALLDKVKMLANHGQLQKYTHHFIGINSRLDGLQAAVLDVKLKYLDEYLQSRNKAASYYLQKLAALNWLQLPAVAPNTTHTFNQFTVLLAAHINREHLISYLKDKGIPTMVYYGKSLPDQLAYQKFAKHRLDTAQAVCQRVLSLPMHTELGVQQLAYICNALINYHG